MNKSDIISDLFSILKTKTVEDRFLTILNIENRTYNYEIDYLNNVLNDYILDVLDIMVRTLIRDKVRVLSEDERLALISDFCVKLSEIDYKTFNKMYKKDLLRSKLKIFKQKIKDNERIIVSSTAMLLILTITTQICKEFIDTYGLAPDYSNEPSSIVVVADDKAKEIADSLEEELSRTEKDEILASYQEKKYEADAKYVSSNTQPVVKNMLDNGIEKSSENVEEETSENEDILQYILNKYNITLEQFNVVKGVVIAESKWDSFEDGYAVINTIYNRTQSKKWLYTAEWCYSDENGNRLKLDGTNIYDVVRSPNQFQVYGNGEYLKYLDKNDGEVVEAIYQFYEDVRNKNYEKMHDYLNFKSYNSELDCYFYQPAGYYGNKFHGRMDDRVETEDNKKGLS